MKIRKGFTLREVCGEKIIVAEGLDLINFNKLISVNSSAAFLWEKLAEKEFTVEDMAQLLVDEYGIGMELAMKDSGNLCKAWQEAGLLE